MGRRKEEGRGERYLESEKKKRMEGKEEEEGGKAGERIVREGRKAFFHSFFLSSRSPH